MDKRTRVRIGTAGVLSATIRGVGNGPVPVRDFTMTGLSVLVDGDACRMVPGSAVDMDILCRGALVACGLVGNVSWAGDGMVGIAFSPGNRWQARAACRVETMACMA